MTGDSPHLNPRACVIICRIGSFHYRFRVQATRGVGVVMFQQGSALWADMEDGT